MRYAVLPEADPAKFGDEITPFVTVTLIGLAFAARIAFAVASSSATVKFATLAVPAGWVTEKAASVALVGMV